MVENPKLYNSYTGSGATPYPIDLDYLGDGDNIKVTVQNTVTQAEEITLVKTTDYSISSDQVTTVVSYSSDWRITISLNMSFNQGTDIISNSNYDPEVLEEAYDKGVLLSRQTKEEIDRTIKLSQSDAGEEIILPPLETLKNGTLGFDSNGDPIARAGFVPDNYDPLFAYVAGDIGQYSGNMWICVTGNTGTVPGTDTDYWEVYTDRKQNWNADILYIENDGVFYAGILYKATPDSEHVGLANIGKTPGTDTAYWQEINIYGTRWDEHVKYLENDITSYAGVLVKATSVQPNEGQTPDASPGGDETYWEIVKTGGSLETEGTVLAATAVNTIMSFDTSGKLITSDNRVLSKSFSAGLLVTATTGANKISSVLSGGKMEGFSGLTIGTDYYLGNSGNLITKGSIAYSEYIVYIGRAISATELDVKIKGPEPTRNQDDGTPIGEVVEWSGNSDLSDIPDGYLKCDGSAISRANYSELNSLMSAASYPWGNGDGSTTFNLPKGAFNTGWVANSDWTNAQLDITHSMLKDLDNINVMFLISKTGNDSDSYEPVYGVYESGSKTIGYAFYEIDTNGIRVQTANDGFRIISTTGGYEQLTTQAYYYKVVVTQKAMSARSIIKVEHITTAGEPIGAIQKIIDWSSTSTWTAGNSIVLNHDMGVEFDKYVGQIFVRDDAIPDKIYNVTDFEIDNAADGQRLNGIDGDLNNCYLQIRSTRGRYLNDSGVTVIVPTSGWSYKVVLTQILKVATYADTGFVTVKNITTSTDETCNLPDASTQIAERIYKRTGAGTGKVLFTTESSQTIDGNIPSTYELENAVKDVLVVFPSGGQWYIRTYDLIS